MYRVMIVDDEPAAIRLITSLIEKKCENFEVIETAYSAEEALEKMEVCLPDVLITDVQMPVMSGLQLIKQCKEKYPELLTVVVSAYQEFEYVKEALRYEVAEYLLKPIVIEDMQKVFQKLNEKLNENYYKKRNIILHKLVNGTLTDERLLKQFFGFEQYYGAIVRLNGLPSRFGLKDNRQVFSDRKEWILTYGRDDLETLYLYPKELLTEGEYVEMILRHINKEQPLASYVTIIVLKNPVDTLLIGNMIKNLYRLLNSKLIIGKSQTLIVEKLDAADDVMCLSETDYDSLKNIEFLMKNKKYSNSKTEMEKLIRKWAVAEYPQIVLETGIRQIYYLWQRYGFRGVSANESEFVLDELFLSAGTVEEIILGLEEICFSEKFQYYSENKMDTVEFFDRICNYIHTHMEETVTLESVCSEMAISKAHLSRLFKKYENSTFNSYLTKIRIEKAKRLLKSDNQLYVKDVAMQVGFKDQFYFSRIFYSYTGVRPSEYKWDKDDIESE